MASWSDPAAELFNAPLSNVRLMDALRAAQAEVAHLRIVEEAPHYTAALTAGLQRVGQLALLLGMGPVAVIALTEALALTPLPAIRSTLGRALSLNGQYKAAQEMLAQAQSESAAELPLAQLGLAICAHDAGDWPAVFAALDSAEPHLNGEKWAHYALNARFIRAEGFIRLNRVPDAQSALDQLDSQTSQSAQRWYRPEWYALKARLMLTSGDPHGAEKAARLGLGAVDDRGNGQMLPTLYRTLAGALERDRSGSSIDDARDARHRSLLAAHNRGPQIELARALYEIGMHYKLYASLPTRRARGVGYMYEADKRYQAMGVPAPDVDRAAVPLL